MFRLDGQVALITGGATGIGYAIAEVFCEAGASIAIVSRRMREGEDAVVRLSNLGGQAIHICSDVTREDDVERAVQAVVGRFGAVDILVNNAGIMRRKALDETAVEDWDEVFDTNLKSAFLCGKHVLPVMIDRGGGCILNIAAILGLKGGAGNTTAYAASKGALITMTKSLAVRYGPLGIRVNSICPGFVPTDFNRHLIDDAPDPAERRREYEAGYPLRRLGEPRDIAYAALYLASREAGWVTGISLVVDGGLMAK